MKITNSIPRLITSPRYIGAISQRLAKRPRSKRDSMFGFKAMAISRK
jgi:hypothetical protein